MKNILFIVLSCLLLISCASQKNLSNEKKCKRILKDDFSRVLSEEFITVLDNDTIRVNELKYVCVFNSNYLNARMEEAYGKWTKYIFLDGKVNPLYIWEKVKLFRDDEKLFIVATTGDENLKTIYSSVMVFDENYKDLLTENSSYKTRLINYFGNLIRKRF